MDSIRSRDLWPFQDSTAQKYETDRDFRVLVDTFVAMLWDGRFTHSELRQAAIFAAMKLESIRIRPLIFDPNNYQIENGTLAGRAGLETE